MTVLLQKVVHIIIILMLHIIFNVPYYILYVTVTYHTLLFCSWSNLVQSHLSYFSLLCMATPWQLISRNMTHWILPFLYSLVCDDIELLVDSLLSLHDELILLSGANELMKWKYVKTITICGYLCHTWSYAKCIKSLRFRNKYIE